MASRTALTCNRYAAGCTKTGMKILRPESSEKEKNAPGKARKRRNRVRFGCWRGWERLETDKNLVRKPGVRTQMNTKTMQHMKKGNWRKPSVSAGFVAGAEGLEPSARGFGVDVGERSRERVRTGVARFSRTSPKRVVLIWCCEKIFVPKQTKRGRKSSNLGSFSFS